MRIVRLILTLCLLFSAACIAQDAPKYPLPYVNVDLSLMPGGYASLAYRAQGGLYWNAPHIVSDIYAAYDDGHKVNDATSNNVSGHDRYLAGFLAFKEGNTFYAAGARWSQLSTTNYVKGPNLLQAVTQGDIRPQFGIGHDWLRDDFSLRGQVLYILPPLHESVSYPGGTVCTGCGNGLQGPEFTIFLPSPQLKKHFFFRMALGIYEFHTTITEPSNVQLTQQQNSSRSVTSSADMGLMYRF